MRSFKTPKGTELPLMDIKGKPYLSVQHRIVWFREEHPDWSIMTYYIGEQSSKDETFFRAEISNEQGRVIATGCKREDKQGFADHYEKSESGSIGRALGFLGYGTAFALDLEEGERLADAPTNEKKSGQAPLSSGEKTSLMKPLNSSTSTESGSYKVTFGKHKDKTIKELVGSIGAQKVSEYINYLERMAKQDNKPLGKSAQELVENFDAFMGSADLDQGMPEPIKDGSVQDQLARLKNTYVGVPGPKMPVPYADDSEPFPTDSDLPF